MGIRGAGALACAVAALTLAGQTVAAPLDDAMVADRRGDYAGELAIVRPLAERGDAAAQTRLGDLYLQGLGAPLDVSRGLQWYSAAAERGDGLAMYYLALWNSLTHDNMHAFMWLNLAIARLSPADADVLDVAIAIRPKAAAAMSKAQMTAAMLLVSAWIANHPDLPPPQAHIGFPRHR